MNALLEHFQGERVLLLLDNFEPVVNPETQEIHRQRTGRSPARPAQRTTPHGQRAHHHPRRAARPEPVRARASACADSGRRPRIALRREHPARNGRRRQAGIEVRAESDPLLQRAREKTRGYPRALEALFAILSSDRYTTLEELLDMPLPENVVEALVGEAFNRLDANAQKVMQALAVYNRPVTPAAVDYLLQPHLPEIDSAPVLQPAGEHALRPPRSRTILFTSCGSGICF